jgi:hypothetical protein
MCVTCLATNQRTFLATNRRKRCRSRSRSRRSRVAIASAVGSVSVSAGETATSETAAAAAASPSPLTIATVVSARAVGTETADAIARHPLAKLLRLPKRRLPRHRLRRRHRLTSCRSNRSSSLSNLPLRLLARRLRKSLLLQRPPPLHRFLPSG